MQGAAIVEIKFPAEPSAAEAITLAQADGPLADFLEAVILEAQILRNMLSIGIHHEQWVKKGLR